MITYQGTKIPSRFQVKDQTKLDIGITQCISVNALKTTVMMSILGKR